MVQEKPSTASVIFNITATYDGARLWSKGVAKKDGEPNDSPSLRLRKPYFLYISGLMSQRGVSCFSSSSLDFSRLPGFAGFSFSGVTSVAGFAGFTRLGTTCSGRTGDFCGLPT